MNRRKGFTLVEMIAVIVLIAVLSIVAVSTYRGINESSKRKTLDAKVEQITGAAEKWARENNITSYKKISVNTLVVEGYLSADDAGTDGLAVIKNPVDGKNMICNTVELTFKNGVVQSKFNANEYDCSLASQSEIDSNIDIRVISRTGRDLTASGAGTIAKWTNEDVAIIVNSSVYDPKATSISYDFEGSTITKNISSLSRYTGTSFVDEADASLYYNVYFIKSELLLNTNIVITYDIPGEGTKSRFYTIRFDKEEATAILKSNSEWITTDSKAQIIVDDGKGSGPAFIYVSRDPNVNNTGKQAATPSVYITGLEVGKYYIWTEDNAGNKSKTYKMILEINNIDTFEPSCEVFFDGRLGDGGWYKEVAVTPKARMLEKAGISGVNIGVNDKADIPEYSAFAAYDSTIEASGEKREDDTTRAGVDYFCHVKTIAGNYQKASKNLKLDRTPPQIDLDLLADPNYTRTKSINFTVSDGGSGISETTRIRYAWALDGATPSNWTITALSIGAEAGVTMSIQLPGTGEGLTGIYYLWVDVSDVRDFAGNYANQVNGRPGKTVMFGPYYFDNTPPVCGTDNGKTNWTRGNMVIIKYCLDNQGTSDQSGCTSSSFNKPYTILNTIKTDTITITDNVGLSTECPINVYLDNTPPTCNGVGGKTNWSKGSYTVTQNCSEDANLQSGCSSASFTKSYTEAQTVTTDSIVITDKVGNTKTCPTNVYLDNTPPICGATSGQSSSWTNQAVTVTVDCQDAHSGCTQSSFSLTHADNKDYDTINIYDNVGNTATCGGTQGFAFLVDTLPPECIIRNPWNECTKGGPTMIIDCIDPSPTGSICSGMRSIAGQAVGSSSGYTANSDQMSDRFGPYTQSTNVYAADLAGNSTLIPIVITPYTQYRKKVCNTANRCEAAGCEIYNSCEHSSCGAATCADAACCGYNYGTGACYGSPQDGMSCLQITYETLTTECNNIGAYWCTPRTAASCADAACCGYNSCPNASCTCNTYYANYSQCGCASYNAPTSWTYAVQTCSGADNAIHCETETQTVYSNAEACKD